MLKRDKRVGRGRMSAAILIEDRKSDGQATQSEIAELAYELWLNRGCPSGSPEEDWFEAERRIGSRTLVPRQSA
jgi:hypothetical protein